MMYLENAGEYNMKVKISLTEFGDEKIIPLEELKNWFPSGRFDKRYPLNYLKKWLHINEKYLGFLGVTYRWDDDKNSLILIPGNKIGLAPLRNPYGAEVYGGIIVRPRLGWIKIYDILEYIDWIYQPNFLKDEEPIISNGVLPRWFKAVNTLDTISQALVLFMKGIEEKRIISRVPKGNIDWYSYSTQSVPYGKYDRFSSRITDYSIDLEIHRQFIGIVKMIEDDISGPEVPIKIKNKAGQLILNIERKLQNVEPNTPDIEKLKKIKIPNFYRQKYDTAIKACIEYLWQSKFSMEAGNLYGLPWSIEMDRLFEYWIEYWAYIFAKRLGAHFYSDIRRNSRIRFYNLKNWKTLKLLKPDVIIEKNDKSMILEVKYKKHLLYLQYGKSSSDILEEHRYDIHQLLSYMSGSVKEKKIGCLIYPKISDNLANQYATLINYTNTRSNVDVVLCGIPFQPEEFIRILEDLWSEKYAAFA